MGRYSPALGRAVQRYEAKVYDRLAVRVYKGSLDIVKAHALNNGESLNGYINRLIAEDIGEAFTPMKTE